MGLELRLQQKMTQQLVMTPQLQQAIKLLQLSHVEMTEVLRDELTQNPLLEEDFGDDAPASPPISDLDHLATAPDPTPSGAELQELGWGEAGGFGDDTGGGGGSSNAASSQEDLPPFEASLSRSISLHDHLRFQLTMLHLLAEERRAALHLIDGIGDDGYLSPEAVAEAAAALNLPLGTVEAALHVLQQLDPLGIASRSLKECLAIQAAPLGNPVASQIIDAYLPLLERRQFAQLAKVLHTSSDSIACAVRLIVRLEPRPGRAFVTAPTQYIVPDIYVHKVGDAYVVSLNEDGLPRLRISAYYRMAMARTAGDTKAYMQDKLRSAAWLLRSLHMRSRTIFKVMESILKLQRAFFEQGVDQLRPLILKEVAEDVGMHESTISRVTTNKYVHTPHGIYELKYFFNSSIGCSDGDSIASESVRHHIERLVASEDARKPYSDQKIVDSLQGRQISIARRTVAKYREMLGIPSSSRRKRIPLQA
jgi:RNA polymerase sigma-54 factor